MPAFVVGRVGSQAAGPSLGGRLEAASSASLCLDTLG